MYYDVCAISMHRMYVDRTGGGGGGGTDGHVQDFTKNNSCEADTIYL
jgi:hypothetical protein